MTKLLIYCFHIIMVLSLSGCALDPTGNLKKSIAGKWIDSSKSERYKRKPVQNKKYIDLAKQNILNGNFSENAANDKEDYTDPANTNIEMYKHMLQRDLEKKVSQHNKSTPEQKSEASKATPHKQEIMQTPKNTFLRNMKNHPLKTEAAIIQDDSATNPNAVLIEEAANLKALLLKAQQDLANCPCAKK